MLFRVFVPLYNGAVANLERGEFGCHASSRASNH